MSKGSGTRSGLLWEVERLLTECEELSRTNPDYGLPQVLLMENVTQVHSKGQNAEDFEQWIKFLESLGYTSKWADLNAKDYNVPQNRNRCFMVSWLGQHTYEFPKPVELEYCMQDFLEDEVEEKFFCKTDKANELIDRLIERYGNELPNVVKFTEDEGDNYFPKDSTDGK